MLEDDGIEGGIKDGPMQAKHGQDCGGMSA